MDKYAEIKEKLDLEKDNFFYVQDLDEGLLVWEYLENEYGYGSERCRQRIFFPHQANPIISYDTEDGWTVIRDDIVHTVISFGIRCDVRPIDEDRFICYGRDHKYPYEEYHKVRKYLSKKEDLDLIDELEEEWYKKLELDEEESELNED